MAKERTQFTVGQKVKEYAQFTVGQKVKIDYQAMVSSNHSCCSPNYPCDSYLKQVEALIKAYGPVGTVTHVFPPAYELTVEIGGQAFSMKGHSWALPFTEDELKAMEKRDQNIAIIQDLCASVAAELVDKVKDGRIPLDWDGHELRQLLADKFTRETSGLLEDKRSRRYKDYERTCLERNLWRM